MFDHMPYVLLITIFSNSSNIFGLDLEEFIDTLTSEVSNILMIKGRGQDIILLDKAYQLKPIVPILIKQINPTGHNN